MELPIGKLASELIADIEAAIKKHETEIKTLQDNINGVKYMVAKLSDFAQANAPKPSDGGEAGGQ